MTEIARKAHKLGINPGGQVLVQEVESISDEYTNRLITDDALLLKLGSRSHSLTQYQRNSKTSSISRDGVG